MDGLIKGILITTIVIFSQWGLAADTDCISHQDLDEIGQDFNQFKQFISDKAEYCESDMGRRWFGIAQSLVVLKNIQPNEPSVDDDDAFTLKAIDDKDWWAYFTKRAKVFDIKSRCQENVVAYVQPFFGNGEINLCPLFFDQNVTSQASVMMHEVRHFDGHRHVTCTQGNEKGNSGACDGRITSKGSYAISVQTLVGMARAKTVDPQEKPAVEAQAVYMAFNKFNVVPKVRLHNSLVVANEQGEVHNWDLNKGIQALGRLQEPAVVLNSANNLTFYPLDTHSDAYRKDNKLMVQMENPGLYAKHYNSETPEERAKYKAISYFAPGGLLKDNTLLTLCKSGSSALHATSLDSRGDFITIISMSTDDKDQNRESLLLTRTGELFRFECAGSQSDRVNFTKTNMKLADAESIVDSFGFDGKQYALLDDGQLAVIDVKGNNLQINPLTLPSQSQNWVSASPMSVPEVF